jgi:hypothetical protein
MAGLLATLGSPGSIDALTTALASRGPDRAVCRLTGSRGMPIELAVRAVMPAIPRVVGGQSGTETVAAFAVDGVASVTALDRGYTEHGPVGLLVGDEPYAVILADAEREELVLACNGDGPGLYYADDGDGWLVASEPTVLAAAGMPVEPDSDVVWRFIETGVCDDSDATFFTGVRRCQQGGAVALGRSGEIRLHGANRTARPHAATTALHAAVSVGRVSVHLTPGLAGAALLGAALARPDRARPIRVLTVAFPSLGGPAASTPAVLVPLANGAVRHTPYSLSPSEFDLDSFLREMGEPVPDLGLYVLWELARTLGSEVDSLVDASLDQDTGGTYMARVSDRLLSRYGVAACCPLRGARPEGENLDDDLEAVIARTLPPTAARYATNDAAGAPTPGQILVSLRDAVAASFASRQFAARPWADQAAALEALGRLCDGELIDEGALMRTYLVERWLAAVAEQPTSEEPESPADLAVGGTMWARLPVRTEIFAPGDQLAAKAAWYVANVLAGLRDDRSSREALGGAWFAAIAGKTVAVVQRRVCPLWDIRPGLAARALARVARRRLPRLGDPWTMQVAISEGGLLRVAGGTLVAALSGSRSERLLPAAAITVFPPQAGAVPPADSSVVRGPVSADAFAGAFADAMRLVLPAEVFGTLAATAVVSADDAGCRLLGFAPGPYADAVADTEAVIAALCADNPAGQGSARTPVVLALRAPDERATPEWDARELDLKEPTTGRPLTRNIGRHFRDAKKPAHEPARPRISDGAGT